MQSERLAVELGFEELGRQPFSDSRKSKPGIGESALSEVTRQLLLRC